MPRTELVIVRCARSMPWLPVDVIGWQHHRDKTNPKNDTNGGVFPPRPPVRRHAPQAVRSTK